MNENTQQPQVSTETTLQDLPPYEVERGNGLLNRFLWWCAGADAQLLERTPYADKIKYAGIGGAVFATGVLAFFSGSFAFYNVFGPKGANAMVDVPPDTKAMLFAGFFGFVWAAIIFNLDRFIVSSTGDGDGTEDIGRWEFVKALPRIAMAILIGIVMSKPLEIKILETEISAALETVQRDEEAALNTKTETKFEGDKLKAVEQLEAVRKRIKEKADYFEKRRIELKEQFEKRRTEVVQQRKRLDEEVAGKVALGGSGKAGNGPAAQTMKANIDRAEQENVRDNAAAEKELEDDKRKHNEGDGSRWAEEEAALLNTLNSSKQLYDEEKALNKKKSQAKDGLAERIMIAHHNYFWITMVLSVFLIFLEVAPIFFKMQLARSAYNYLSENEQALTRARWGIDLQRLAGQSTASGGKVVDQLNAHMWMPDTVLKEQQKRYDTEQKMAETVHAEYWARVRPDIRNNLENYIGGPERVPPRRPEPGAAPAIPATPPTLAAPIPPNDDERNT